MVQQIKDYPAEQYPGQTWRTPDGTEFFSDGRDWVLQTQPEKQ